jgi:peptidyl-prolyl cis-trans isomerase D
MLDTFRRGQRWLVGGVVFIVGGVFVAYLGLGGPRFRAPTSDSVIQLDSRRYSLQDVEQVREEQEQRLRQSLGSGFDPKAAGPYLDQMAAEQLIQRAVLASEAERVGLRATDDEVRQVVRTYFKTPEGTIDTRSAQDYAERRFGSERRFAQEIRDDILYSKLLQLIDSSVEVSDAEVRDAVRYRREAVRLALVVVDPAKGPADAAVDPADVAKLLADDGARVHRFYDEHPERYHQPERVRARHILLRVPKDASPAQIAKIQAQAEKVLARIQGGEDFAKVAQEVSEDPGSKAQGGELGFFPRGQMAPAFEKVAFSLKPGETSGLVRTDFGFHIIRVEAHEAARNQSFDEVAHAIAEELIRGDRARARAEQEARHLADAVRSGKSLVDAAREAGVDIQRTDWITRRGDGFVPGLGPAPEVLTTAFALTLEKPSSDHVFDVGGKHVLVELLERREPTAEELTADLAEQRKQLLEARRTEARNAWLRAARARVTADGRLRVDLTALQHGGEPASG